MDILELTPEVMVDRRTERRLAAREIREYLKENNYIIPKVLFETIVKRSTCFYEGIADRDKVAVLYYQKKQIRKMVGLVKSKTHEAYTVPKHTKNHKAVQGAKNMHLGVSQTNKMKAQEEQLFEEKLLFESDLSISQLEKKDEGELNKLIANAY